MQAVRVCCPAYVGFLTGDLNPDSDALQPSGGDESVDVVLNVSKESRARGRKSSEAIDAELISAIDAASEPDTQADESGLKSFIRTLENHKTKFDAEIDDENVFVLLT